MTRKKTPTQPPLIAPTPPTPPEPGTPETLSPPQLELEVEEGTPPENNIFGNLMARAEASALVDETPEEKQTKKARAHHSTREDFATLISSVFTLLLAAANLPDPYKPLAAEVDGVSYYSTRILLRHFPIAQKLNADAMDIIGLLSVGAGYYMRIAPNLPKKDDNPPGGRKPPTNRTPGPGDGQQIFRDDIAQISPETDEFLNRALERYNQNNGGAHGNRN